MEKRSTRGGYVLVARKIEDSGISRKPPHFREIWRYLIQAAVWKDCIKKGIKFKRGQLITSYEQISEDLSWFVGKRIERYKKHHIDMTFRYLKREKMIATMKPTRKPTTKPTKGMMITILNYDKYQNPKRYETDNETDKETDKVGVVPYIEEIKNYYVGIDLPKNFPLDMFVKYEDARMKGKKDGRKKWSEKERISAIKQFIGLGEFINEIKLKGFDGLNNVLKEAVENKWRGFTYFKRGLKGMRERNKQNQERFQKEKDGQGRPQPKDFHPSIME